MNLTTKIRTKIEQSDLVLRLRRPLKAPPAPDRGSHTFGPSSSRETCPSGVGVTKTFFYFVTDGAAIQAIVRLRLLLGSTNI